MIYRLVLRLQSVKVISHRGTPGESEVRFQGRNISDLIERLDYDGDSWLILEGDAARKSFSLLLLDLFDSAGYWPREKPPL